MGKLRELLNSPSQLDKLVRTVFDQVDTDKSGAVSEDELAVLMKNISGHCGIQAPTKSDIHDAMSALDKNNDGQISLDEFKVLIVQILKTLDKRGI